VGKWSKVAGLFVVGVRDFQWSQDLENFFRDYSVSGAALFNSPFDSPSNIWSQRESALEAVYEFQRKALDHVSFLSVDQEGGRVRRFRGPYIPLPAAQIMTDTQRKPEEFAELFEIAAQQLRLSGIALNFAPVCDLRTPSSNQVIGDRSFSTDAKLVEAWARVWLQSFRKAGVASTLKHFPGHGSSQDDSHQGVAVLGKTKEEVYRTDRLIFERLAPLAEALMTSHTAFPEDPDQIFSLSAELIEEFRKGPCNDLLLISDDLLTMKAVNERSPWIDCYEAQYDYILVCDTLDGAARAIEETIRHCEKTLSSFEDELLLEERVQKSRFVIKSTTSELPFKEWTKKILGLEANGLRILNELGL
jgi:beta-N-acetylhexosaminidase